jgi:hypothetical protein
LIFSGEGSFEQPFSSAMHEQAKYHSGYFPLLRAKWEIGNSIAQEGALILYFSGFTHQSAWATATWRLKLDFKIIAISDPTIIPWLQ